MDHSYHNPHTGHDMSINHDMHVGHEHTESSVTENILANTHDHQNPIQHMMSMTFHGGVSETILFDWWKTNSVAGFIGSFLVIFIMASLYESLKYYREYLFYRSCRNLQYRAVQPPEEKSSPCDETRVHVIGGVFRREQPSIWSKFHLWQTILHAVQITVSYLLMLIFMTYNYWLCLAVVGGTALGNFLFGWKKSIIVDMTDHCH